MWSIRAIAVLAAAALCAAASVEPSISAPGGLDPSRTPQFVLLTHDDAVDSRVRKLMRKVTEDRQSENGCPVSATMFALVRGTECDALLDLYDRGYEVADHTLNHEKLPGEKLSYIETEIVDARKQLAECGIPEEDIVGFRSPYLDTDAVVRETLHENGFLYDSSLIEGTAYSLSEGFEARVWPWDMEYGIPINCSLADVIVDTAQNCEAGEAWPGLFEVPVWQYSEVGDEPYAMDPGYNYDCECQADNNTVFDILKANFDASYNGTRAPFPIYIHVYWLQEGDNLEGLQQFVDYALSKPDTYFVTMRQLIAWMQDPVPADELTPERLGCGNPGGAGPDADST